LTLTKPAESGNRSLAFAGNIPCYCVFNALNSSKEGVWVVDSRATDHMVLEKEILWQIRI